MNAASAAFILWKVLLITITKHFQEVEDPRVERGKLHNLLDIIILSICASVGGANSYDEIELFGNTHEEWFKKILALPNGIPSHDTLDRVFSRLDPEEFRTAFLNWTKEITGILKDVIAIDGQTHRGARKVDQIKSPIHMVSAWATGLKIVLAQVKTNEKSNEITAIPEVLKLLEIKGCIITIDAMGCQQKIAQQIIDQKGDYAFGLKGNQGTSLTAVEKFFSKISDEKCEKFSSVDKGHGRVETREYFSTDANLVPDLKDWPGLQSVIKVLSTRYICAKDTTSIETRFYLSSLKAKNISEISNAIRSHWGIENSLHHTLDVTFRQDASRVRMGNGPENFGLLRHFAMNILRGAPNARRGNPSKKLKRMRAAMDIKYLEEVLKNGNVGTVTL